MAPGGVSGIVMALVLVVATDSPLLAMRSIQELPPVSLTFLILIVVAAIRWGGLSAAANVALHESGSGPVTVLAGVARSASAVWGAPDDAEPSR
jgi:hypothetical protein